MTALHGAVLIDASNRRASTLRIEARGIAMSRVLRRLGLSLALFAFAGTPCLAQGPSLAETKAYIDTHSDGEFTFNSIGAVTVRLKITPADGTPDKLCVSATDVKTGTLYDAQCARFEDLSIAGFRTQQYNEFGTLAVDLRCSYNAAHQNDLCVTETYMGPHEIGRITHENHLLFPCNIDAGVGCPNAFRHLLELLGAKAAPAKDPFLN
jgi:hypothetical protein